MSNSQPSRTVGSEPVFISHAVADHDLVNFFVDQLLVGGAGLAPTQIFNVSSAASPIAAGDNFNPRIRQAIADSKLVVALISPNFYRSPFCMSELGAAWAGSKLLPILVPPVSFKSLEGILQGIHCIRIDDKKKLFEIYDRFEKVDWFQRNPSAIFASRVDDFLTDLSDKLQKLPSPSVVDRDDYKKLEVRVAELTAKLQEAAKAPSEMAKQTPGIASKAAAQVDEKGGFVQTQLLPTASPSKREGSSDEPAFERQLRDLVNTANQLASVVPGVVQRMVYARLLRESEEFHVYQSEKDDWDMALKEGLIRRDDHGEPYANFKSARIGRLSEAYEDVGKFLGTAKTNDLHQYEVKYRHVPELGEPEFARKWFYFWWRDDPADAEIPF